MDSTSSGRNPLVETNISPPENSCLERLFPVWGQFWRILNRVYPPTSHTRRFGSVFFLPQGLPLGLQWRFCVRFGTASSTQNLGEFSPKVGVIFRWFFAWKILGVRNAENKWRGGVECEGSYFVQSLVLNFVGPGGALKTAEISGGTLLALSTENGGSGKLYCSETSNWIATLQGAYWKGKQHSCKSLKRLHSHLGR